jgi:hypothetical protein
MCTSAICILVFRGPMLFEVVRLSLEDECDDVEEDAGK